MWILISILLIFILGAVDVYVGPTNHDVGWLLYVTEAWLSGAEPYVDIIDLNSPSIFIFNIPAVILSKLLGTSVLTTFKLYMFAVLATSTSLCVLLLRSNTGSMHREILRFSMLSILITAISIGYNFGQREHILVILLWPYILSTYLFISGGSKMTWKISLLAGLLAGFGITLKPQFAIIWLATEAFLVFIQRSRPWQRVETVGIISMLVTYFLGVLYFFPKYIQTLRIGWHVYSTYDAGYNTTLVDLLDKPETPLLLIVIFLAFVTRTEKYSKALNFFAVLALSSWIMFIVQAKGWSYQAYPLRTFLAIYFLMTSLVLGRWFLGLSWVKKAYATTAVSSLLAVLLLLASSRGHPNPMSSQDLERLSLLTQQKAAGQSIAALTTEIYPVFPLVSNIGARWSLHYHPLWPLPGLYPTRYPPEESFPYHSRDTMNKIESSFFNTIVSDLVDNPPRLLLIHTASFKQGFGHTSFDYVEYFSQDPRFAKLLRQYQLAEKVGDYQFYWLNKSIQGPL